MIDFDSLPKEGWKPVSVNDLGDISGTCELCGSALRFQHIVKNESYGSLSIGVECAGNLISGNDLSYCREADKKIKYEARKKAKNMKLYNEYLERCRKWDELHPNSKCIVKTYEEIYGGK